MFPLQSTPTHLDSYNKMNDAWTYDLTTQSSQLSHGSLFIWHSLQKKSVYATNIYVHLFLNFLGRRSDSYHGPGNMADLIGILCASINFLFDLTPCSC